MNKRKWYHEVKILCGILAIIILSAGYTASGLLFSFGNRTGAARDVAEEKNGAAPAESEYVMEPPKIAITFDDGPSALCTGRLLDGLKERGVKATFFLIGEYAKDNPKLVKRIYEEGHMIGNHTYHHVDITRLSDEEAAYEINETDKVVYSITGEHIRYVRPPFGAWQKDLELST